MSPWLYSGVVFMLGVLFLFFPAFVRSVRTRNMEPLPDPSDDRKSLMVYRFVGVVLLLIAAVAAFAGSR